MFKIKSKIYIIFILMLSLTFSLIGCGSKTEKSNKEKKLNIYVDIKDKHSLNIIKFITDEYKKENPKATIIVSNAMGTDTLKDISKEKVGDIIFVSRNKMIELQSKGLLADVSAYYEKNKINEKYCNVMNSYGRYSDKYYGIGVIPYTIEVLYNKEALKKLNVKEPINIKEGEDILIKLNKESIKVPVILTDDIDINNALASLMIGNEKNVYNVDNIYNSSKEAYKEKKEFQSMFDSIQTLYKNGVVNKNTFEIGNENAIKKFVNGDIPMIISISYYYKEFNQNNVGLIEDYSSIASFKDNVPVIVNALLCKPINGENEEEANDFIKFAFSDTTQKKLLEKGFITGNSKVNEEAKGMASSIAKHLSNSNENGIIFLYNLPEKFYAGISSRIEKILSGQYKGDEWNTLVDEVFKYE